MIFGFGEEKKPVCEFAHQMHISYSDLYADLENISAYAGIQNA